MIDIFERNKMELSILDDLICHEMKKSRNWYELFEDNHCILQAVSSVLVLTFHSQVEDYEIGM